MKNYRTVLTVLALELAMMTGPGYAATPDRDWPNVVVTPILDMSLRDAAICRAKDATYYLTGTFGTPLVGRAATGG